MTKIEDFFEAQNRFQGLSINEQICRLAWFLHSIDNELRVSPRDISDAYRSLHMAPPQTSVYMPRLNKRKPPLLLWDKSGYFLEGRERKRLDDLMRPSNKNAVASQLLISLVNKVHDEPRRVFLDEAIRCYQVSAFRAAIVMAWNLAYDHLRQWILADTKRLEGFNTGSAKRFAKSQKCIVTKSEDFDDYKESEFLDACSSGKVISKNLEIMLREKLKRRNMAAHPSTISILQPQADDVITDLVKNVLLAL